MAHHQTGNESPGNCAEDASPLTAEEELFSQETSQDASIQNIEDDCSLLEQFSWEENFADTSKTSEEKRKRKVSSEEDVTHDTDAYKQSRPEISGMSDQVVSNFSDNDSINPDSRTNEITMSSQIAMDSENLAFIYSEFPNFEELNPKNQELKAFDYLRKEANFSSGQCTAYNKIFQKDDATCEITDAYVSKVANFSSVDDKLAAPGTSHCLENNSHSKSCVEKIQNGSPLKQQPPVETERKQSNCLSCLKSISEHEDLLDVMDRYKCCRCPVIHENFNDLQIHVYNEHSRPHYCDVCQMDYSDASSHDVGGTCDVCKENFECEYQLEEHYLSAHEDILETHCRICQRNLDEHSTFSEGVKKYQCCFSECLKQCENKSKLMNHHYKHFLLKIFKCEVCGNHFKHPTSPRKHLKSTHPLCTLCEKRFLNIYFLNKHRHEEHGEEFS